MIFVACTFLYEMLYIIYIISSEGSELKSPVNMIISQFAKRWSIFSRGNLDMHKPHLCVDCSHIPHSFQFGRACTFLGSFGCKINGVEKKNQVFS